MNFGYCNNLVHALMNDIVMILASLVQKTLITKKDGKHLQTRTVVVIVDGIIVPTPLEGGGTIYSNGFFVQSILAD